jgi:hypothetical protein
MKNNEQAFRWPDPPVQEPYEMSKRIQNLKLILNWNRPQGLMCKSQKKNNEAQQVDTEIAGADEMTKRG